MAAHGLSRVTVRQAIALLTRNGRVVARRGKGTFVVSPMMRHDIGALRGFYDALREQGIEPQTELLEFSPAVGRTDRTLPEGLDLPVRLRRRYLIEGRPSRDYAVAKAFMYREPEAWHALMEKLSTAVIAYLNAQVDAGVHVVQLFDSWVGALNPSDYVTYVQPHVSRIFAEVRGAPTIHFGTGTAALLEPMTVAGGDVIGVDHRQSLDRAWERIGFDRGVQGNLDATRVIAGWDATAEGARDVLRRAANRPGHIFNLGHGVLPDSHPDLLRRLVDLVHAESAR